ncbi:NUDIX domain-containing protein [Thermoflavimicrobium daqui]|uniref:NUDIX domain-containing protein n=1 Tax=Thermoflavimicrobium daqui TaxID=2137476 RepID=UPI00143D35C6|nr:NUDIX hydrolase [Thermoflavimicrobium daqui]
MIIAIAAKCAVVLKQSKVLVLKKTVEEMNGDFSKSSYDLLGGRVRYGEEVEEALRRELLEEAGITCEKFNLITTWPVIRSDGLQIHIFLYRADFKGGVITLSSEHDDYQWISLQDGATSSHPKWITRSISLALES